MKRIAVIMFSATLILCSVFLITVFSADGDSLTYGSFTYQVDDNDEVTITKLDSGTTGTVIIPSSIEGKSVIALGNGAFSDCGLVTELRIPSSVKSIGNGALNGLTNIERIDYLGTLTQWCGVKLGNAGSVPFSITDSVYINGRIITEIGADDWQGLTSISDYAFDGCNTLSSVVLPDTLTSIGQFSFFGCDNLTSLNVAPGNTKYHSSGNCIIETESKILIKGISNSVIPDDGSVTAIGSTAFRACAGLTRIEIPEGVTEIKAGTYLWTISAYLSNGAFSGCPDLEEVVLPGTIETIGTGAFSNCKNLKNISLTNGIKKIGDSAFGNCIALTEITIPETVENIGRFILYGCASLETLHYNAKNAVLKAKTISVSILSTTKRVDWLYNCPALKTLVFGKNVEALPDYAFYNINTIETISLWNGIQTIGEKSFELCDSFSKVYFSGTPEEWFANYNRYFNSNAYIHEIYYVGGICCKSDELSNISVEFEYGTFGTPNDSELSLDVDSISANDPRFSAFKVNVDGEQYALYSIHMTDADNNDKQPVNDSKVTVKIPLP
ncbi:MAG: leucine-rich repeat domain-containing protein, partial [Clostridia bacterium]|nr:leucine-rich repeat domain-containing protein [Clostridia bacterium]